MPRNILNSSYKHGHGEPATRDEDQFQLVQKKRACLRCGKPFLSDHAGLRKCKQCASTNVVGYYGHV